MDDDIITDLHTSTPTRRAGFLVVDSNARDTLARYVDPAHNGGAKLLIPDIVMLEWAKGRWEGGVRVEGDEWMGTFERWLEVLEPAHLSCAVGQPVGRLIRTEIEHGPSGLSLVSGEATKRLIGLILEWRAHGREVLEEMREAVNEVQARADELRFDHDKNQALSVLAFRAIESTLTPDEVSSLRGSSTSADDKDAIRFNLVKRQDLRDSFAPGIAEFFGTDVARVKYLLSMPTVTFRFAASALSLALHDIQTGSNAASRNAERITNDIVDADVATSASLARGLLSNDRGAKRTYSDLCGALGIEPVINPDPAVSPDHA